jgi:hypothetical protein
MSIRRMSVLVAVLLATLIVSACNNTPIPAEQEALLGNVTVQIQNETVSLPNGSKDAQLNVCTVDGSLEGGPARQDIRSKSKITYHVLNYFREKFDDQKNWVGTLKLDDNFYFASSLYDAASNVRTLFVQQCADEEQARSQGKRMMEIYSGLAVDFDFTED